MGLFVVRSDVAFRLLRPVSKDRWGWRGGVPITETWEVPILTVSEGREDDFIEVDCLELISGSDGLILSEFARGVLDGLLAPAGEFWPITVLGRRYWWFNCIACLEALDRERTDADWSVVDGDWGSFSWITTTRRLEFERTKMDAAQPLFRVPEYPQGVLFGTDALRDAVTRHELTGFQFDRVWSAAGGGVTDPPGLGLAGVFPGESEAELELRRADALSILTRRRNFER